MDWICGQLLLRDRVYCGDFKFNQRRSRKFYRPRAGRQSVKTVKVTKVGNNGSGERTPSIFAHQFWLFGCPDTES